MDRQIIIYDDKQIQYLQGYVEKTQIEVPTQAYRDMYGNINYSIGGMQITVHANKVKETMSLDLDPTLMKRLAMFNKERELLQIQEKIKEAKTEYQDIKDKIKFVKDNYSGFLKFCEAFESLVDNHYHDDDYDIDEWEEEY